MSEFGTILAESLSARDALRAASAQLGTTLPDIVVLEAQLLALVKVLGDATVIDLDDYIAELRAIIANFQASSGVDLEMALKAALPPSNVRYALMETDQITALVGQLISYTMVLYDSDLQVTTVPGSVDTFQFSSPDDPLATVPPTGPANTDGTGRSAAFTAAFTRTGTNGVFPIPGRISPHLVAVDMDVPGWNVPANGARDPGVRIIKRVAASIPLTATAGVQIQLTINAYDDGDSLVTDQCLGVTVSSSDPGALGAHNPYDLAAFFGPVNDGTQVAVTFAAPGTYTVTAAFQSAAMPGLNLDTPDIVFTVVVT